ncbi:unnamed protein product [Fraxinus pennsylvanica]|uniref:Pentatricopeptide repeat-containing protein n=1 Tax=Fraxinus pennsylvanica TaxID=56036 RepID=A0AAD2ACS1_9LAMI|nr:unnamed protein product [Fraxinus pennsylvanica]
MSSSIYSHLSGLFRKSSKPAATAAAAVAGATTTINTSQQTASEPTRLTAAAIKEKQLESLVKKIKKNSESPRFRRRHLNYEPAVRRLAAAGRLSSIHDILNHQKQYEDISNERFTVRLLWLYGKSQMFDHALDLFEEMPQLNCQRTVLSFNALLAACVHSKQFDKTVKIFHEIPEKLAIQPDIVSYNTVIKAFCELGSLDTAVSMMDELDKNGIHPTTATFNTLLYAFYKSGRFDEAEKIWGLMEKKNVSADARSYNAKLHGLVKEKRMKGIQKRSKDGDIDFAHELCKKSIDENRIYVKGILQVINKLVEQSKINEAKELMELGSSIRVLRDRLSMRTQGMGAIGFHQNSEEEEPSLQD